MDYHYKDKLLIPQKINLLYSYQSNLDRINELQECVEYINWKQQFYDDVLSGKTKYYSNLIDDED